MDYGWKSDSFSILPRIKLYKIGFHKDANFHLLDGEYGKIPVMGPTRGVASSAAVLRANQHRRLSSKNKRRKKMSCLYKAEGILKHWLDPSTQ